MEPKQYEIYRQNIFDTFENPNMYPTSEQEVWNFVLPCHQVMKASRPTETKPKYYKDIHFELNSFGKPTKLPHNHENAIKDVVQHLKSNTLLRKQGVRASFKHYIEMIGFDEYWENGVNENTLSKRWFNLFSSRQKLWYRCI